MRQLQLSPSTIFCVAKSPVNIWEGWQSPRPAGAPARRMATGIWLIYWDLFWLMK